MNDKQYRVAVLIPDSLVEGAVQHNNIAREKNKVQIKEKVFREPDDDMHGEMGFDPITSSPFVWFSMQFIGSVSLGVVASLIANVIYDKWKKKVVDSKLFEIKIRFPTGEILTYSSDMPIDLDELKNKINQAGEV